MRFSTELPPMAFREQDSFESKEMSQEELKKRTAELIHTAYEIENQIASSIQGKEALCLQLISESKARALSWEEAKLVAAAESIEFCQRAPTILQDMPRFLPLFRFRRALELTRMVESFAGSKLFIGSGDTAPEIYAFSLEPPEVSFSERADIRKQEKFPFSWLPGDCWAIEPNKRTIGWAKELLGLYPAANEVHLISQTLGKVLQKRILSPGLSLIIWIAADPAIVSKAFSRIGRDAYQLMPDEFRKGPSTPEEMNVRQKESLTKAREETFISFFRTRRAEKQMRQAGRDTSKVLEPVLSYLAYKGFFLVTTGIGNDWPGFFSRILFLKTIEAFVKSKEHQIATVAPFFEEEAPKLFGGPFAVGAYSLASKR